MPALLGILAADVLSGLVHWFCDSVFEEETPIIGRLIIHPFREHHRDPVAMTRHGFLEVSGNTCLALTPPLALAGWGLASPAADRVASLLAHEFVLAFAFAAFWTNQLHKWAHMPAVPHPVAWLQRAGAFLRPERHARHHRLGGRAYCVLTGWANAPLDRVGFFAGIERVMRALGFRWFSQRAEWEWLAAPEDEAGA